MNTTSDSLDDDIPDASELLDFELIAKSHPEKGRGLWLWVVLILILAGGGWAGWIYLQDQKAEKMNSGGVPLIMAPQFALKEKPVDPGGMKIPDRDKLVYDRMNGTGGNGVKDGVERLLPPPETPLQPPRRAPSQTTTMTPLPAPLPAPVAAPAIVPAPVPAPPAPTPTKSPTVLQPLTAVKKVTPRLTAKTTKPVVKETAAKVKPSGTPKSKAIAGQGYMVQLSAVRTEQAAKSEWARLAKKHADILGGLDPVIQRADLGTRGIFYRVRGGWFASRSEAKAVCAKLARRNVGCLIAKP